MATNTASPLTFKQLNALNHYVLTGRTSLLDDVASNPTFPPEEHELVYNDRLPDDFVEFPTDAIQIPIEAHYPEYEEEEPQIPVVDHRNEPNQPVNISLWRLAIPEGAHPPNDAPWSSHASESVTDVEDHSDRRIMELKPGPDITLSSTVHSSLSDPSADVNQWRYENFVDWWRAGMPKPGQQPHVIDAPSSTTSVSDHGDFIRQPPPPPSKKASSRKASSHRSRVEIQRTPLPMPPNLINFPSRESLTKVYYRLQTRHRDPLPVRDLVRDDRSIGILYLDDLRTYRVRDLKTLIFSRECSHTSPISPRSSFIIPRSSPSEPPLKLKLKLYYLPPHLDSASTVSTERRKLNDDDILPKGVGLDEPSALVVKIVVDEPRIQMRPLIRSSKGCVRMCGKGVAVIVRGLARGITKLGEGLASFADCLSSAKRVD